MAKGQLTLGQFIESARLDAGLSIRELGDLSGVLKTIVGQLILDQINQPKPDHLMRLAQVLEVRAADMFLLAGIPVPKDQPSVEALLRSEYELPESAVREAKRQIDTIVARYARQQSPNPRKEGPHGNN